jgi:hypothetical protein
MPAIPIRCGSVLRHVVTAELRCLSTRYRDKQDDQHRKGGNGGRRTVLPVSAA